MDEKRQKILNAKTGRWVYASGAIGKQIVRSETAAPSNGNNSAEEATAIDSQNEDSQNETTHTFQQSESINDGAMGMSGSQDSQEDELQHVLRLSQHEFEIDQRLGDFIQHMSPKEQCEYKTIDVNMKEQLLDTLQKRKMEYTEEFRIININQNLEYEKSLQEDLKKDEIQNAIAAVGKLQQEEHSVRSTYDDWKKADARIYNIRQKIRDLQKIINS